MRSKEFLNKVWGGYCNNDDYVCISIKGKGSWKDIMFKFSEFNNKIDHIFRKYSQEQYDLYFCPLPFNRKSRRKEFVKPCPILWSDVDKGTIPPYLDPSILWESSPDRLQAIWLLNKKHSPAKLSEVNKDLTYFTGADKGGWDLTQVLRIPGTFNHKYDPVPQVELIHFTDNKYELDFIEGKVSVPDVSKEPNIEEFNRILNKHRKIIPREIYHLLRKKNVQVGNRSEILWKIENELIDAGLTNAEIFVLVKCSQWNKFRDRNDEDYRINQEIQKARGPEVKTAITKEEIEIDDTIRTSFIIETASDIMGTNAISPGWLVDKFWLRGSNGIVAGEPKSFKSTLLLDMALSLATGHKFLDQYEVYDQCPVLMIQNENSEWIMKDRIGKILTKKGLAGSVKIIEQDKVRIHFPDNDIPAYFVNQQNFSFSDDVHITLLEKLIEKLQPKMVIFDPLYLMFDGDINSAQELNPVLSKLLDIKNKYDIAVCVIHHWHKTKGEHSSTRGGQRMLGSATLHGWTESAWYIGVKGETVEDDTTGIKLQMEREFRGAGIHPKLDLLVNIGNFGIPEYNISTEIHKPDSVKQEKSITDDATRKEILGFLSSRTETVSIGRIIEETGIPEPKIKKQINVLVKDKLIKRMGSTALKLIRK